MSPTKLSQEAAIFGWHGLRIVNRAGSRRIIRFIEQSEMDG
jgi:hypothetical protein